MKSSALCAFVLPTHNQKSKAAALDISNRILSSVSDYDYFSVSGDQEADRSFFKIYIPRTGISVSYGNSICNFLRNIHNFFYCGFTILHSHKQCTGFFFLHIKFSCRYTCTHA